MTFLFFFSQSGEDSDEDFQQQLDEIDAELNRSAEKKKKLKQSKKVRGGKDQDLFESDDEWTYDGLDNSLNKSGHFNPRQEPDLLNGTGR